MITKKLQYIFLLSILLFYLHGLEEVVTGFYSVDPTFHWLASQFDTIKQAAYYVFHFWWWLLLPIVFLLMKGGKWAYIVLALYGLVLVNESYHFIRTLIVWQYFPGTITALGFPIIAVFYWKELIINWKRK